MLCLTLHRQARPNPTRSTLPFLGFTEFVAAAAAVVTISAAVVVFVVLGAVLLVVESGEPNRLLPLTISAAAVVFAVLIVVVEVVPEAESGDFDLLPPISQAERRRHTHCW